MKIEITRIKNNGKNVYFCRNMFTLFGKNVLKIKNDNLYTNTLKKTVSCVLNNSENNSLSFSSYIKKIIEENDKKTEKEENLEKNEQEIKHEQEQILDENHKIHGVLMQYSLLSNTEKNIINKPLEIKQQQLFVLKIDDNFYEKVIKDLRINCNFRHPFVILETIYDDDTRYYEILGHITKSINFINKNATSGLNKNYLLLEEGDYYIPYDTIYNLPKNYLKFFIERNDIEVNIFFSQIMSISSTERVTKLCRTYVELWKKEDKQVKNDEKQKIAAQKKLLKEQEKQKNHETDGKQEKKTEKDALQDRINDLKEYNENIGPNIVFSDHKDKEN